LSLVLLLHALYLVGDRTWFGECVAVWPPLGWLVLLLPAVVRTRSATLAVLLLLLAGLHGERPRLGSDTPPAAQALRVITWNVAGDPAALQHLRELNPDIVLLQEMAGAPRQGWEAYQWTAGFDPATLSRHPARRLPTRKVGPWTEPLLVLVSLPDGCGIVVANVRLVLPSVVTWIADGFRGDPRDRHAARVGQFEALARLLDESVHYSAAGAVLLCGDFNSPPGLPTMAPLRSFLTDAWTVAGRGWGGTATAELPLARIDQCWASASLRPVSARVLRAPVSDHRMLLVDYDLGSVSGTGRD
jgi:endonuclease/exonuclease/phosphatase (EEP) superfamily protein YafD